MDWGCAVDGRVTASEAAPAVAALAPVVFLSVTTDAVEALGLAVVAGETMEVVVEVVKAAAAAAAAALENEDSWTGGRSVSSTAMARSRFGCGPTSCTVAEARGTTESLQMAVPTMRTPRSRLWHKETTCDWWMSRWGSPSLNNCCVALSISGTRMFGYAPWYTPAIPLTTTR